MFSPEYLFIIIQALYNDIVKLGIRRPQAGAHLVS